MFKSKNKEKQTAKQYSFKRKREKNYPNRHDICYAIFK